MLFVRHARVLELMRITCRSKSFETISEEWIAYQKRQLGINKRASLDAKVRFVHDYGRNYTDLPEHIHDGSSPSRNGPFDSWFER